MGIDIDRADPRKLAEALRQGCNQAINCDAFMDPPGVVPHFAAALLAVLDRCIPLLKDEDELIHRSEIDADWTGEDAHGEGFAVDESSVATTVLRAAARAWLEHGGELSGVAATQSADSAS